MTTTDREAHTEREGKGDDDSQVMLMRMREDERHTREKSESSSSSSSLCYSSFSPPPPPSLPSKGDIRLLPVSQADAVLSPESSANSIHSAGFLGCVSSSSLHSLREREEKKKME